MDYGIINGTGNGQLLGILNDPRVTNVVEFTEKEFGDWTEWRRKLFAIIPLSKRGTGEFLFSASTVESYLLTMEDSNGRPLFKEATEITLNDSNSAGRFFGRTATLVEPDIIADLGTAAAACSGFRRIMLSIRRCSSDSSVIMTMNPISGSTRDSL